MSSTEWWLLAAIIAAALAIIARLIEPQSPQAGFYSPALLALSLGLAEIALLIALP